MLQECKTAAEVRNLYRQTRQRIFQKLTPVTVRIVDHTPRPVRLEIRRPAPWEPGPPRPVKRRVTKGNVFYLQKLLREVAADYGLSASALKSSRRFQTLCRARFEFCYRAFTETDASLTRIASIINRTDHTTVRNGIAVHCRHYGLEYPASLNLDYWLKCRADQRFQPREGEMGRPVTYSESVSVRVTAEMAAYLDLLISDRAPTKAAVIRSLLEEIRRDDEAAHQEAA